MEGGRQQFAELQIKTVACPRFEPAGVAYLAAWRTGQVAALPFLCE